MQVLLPLLPTVVKGLLLLFIFPINVVLSSSCGAVVVVVVVSLAPFLLSLLSSVLVEMMRTIKRALDPKNIMNPGKIFTL